MLAIAKDGTYRIMTAPEKVLVTAPLLYAEVFNPEQGVEFTVVNRDKKKMADDSIGGALATNDIKAQVRETGSARLTVPRLADHLAGVRHAPEFLGQDQETPVDLDDLSSRARHRVTLLESWQIKSEPLQTKFQRRKQQTRRSGFVIAIAKLGYAIFFLRRATTLSKPRPSSINAAVLGSGTTLIEKSVIRWSATLKPVPPVKPA